MEQKILVAYASKYGATAEIAEKIGEVLQNASFVVDVQPVKQVKDVAAYTAVILGSAIYIGQWRKEAVRFLQKYEDVLGKRQFYIFSTGPTGEGDPVELLNGWEMPGKIKPIVDNIQPREVVVFHGAVEPEKLNFIEKSMIKNVKAPVGDFRDWDAIIAWAESVANALKVKVEV